MSASSQNRSRGIGARWFLTPIVVLIASTYAMSSTLVRFAYDSGADTFAIIATRQCVAVTGMALVLGVMRVPVRPSRREGCAALLIGVLMVAYSSAMYQSFVYMPIALTVVTFYTYPLMTGLVVWIIGQENIGWRGGITLPLAFTGVVLLLDIFGGHIDAHGVAWALLAAAGFAAFLILSARLFDPNVDAPIRMLIMLSSAAVVAVSAIIVLGLLGHVTRFPSSTLGWVGLMGSSLCYFVAITGLMFVVPLLGASRVALFMNAEPVASLVLTYLILGDRLKPIQLLGIVCIVIAILIFRPIPRPEPPSLPQT